MTRYKLGEICEIVSGSTPKTGIEEYWDGDAKWITPAEIDDDSYIISDSVRKITELGVKKTGLSPLPEGTVILSSRAPIGKVAIAGCEMYCNQGFKNLICSDIINNRYLYWFLKGNTAYLNSLGRGATFKEISKQIVSAIEINVPTLTEQKAVVSQLEKVNEIIRMRGQELQKLDELVKARFVELFGDPVASENKRKLSEIGRIFTGNTPSMKEPSYYESNDIPFIKPSDLNESGVTNIEGVEAYISEKARPVARIIPPNAVLVTCIGTIGKIGITSRESCCNQQINFVVPNDGINSLYLAYCLTFFKSTLQNIANAPVVPIINKTQFSELEVPVFDIDKQNQFAAFVEQTDKSKVVVQKALDEAQLLFDSLMQKYFG